MQNQQLRCSDVTPVIGDGGGGGGGIRGPSVVHLAQWGGKSYTLTYPFPLSNISVRADKSPILPLFSPKSLARIVNFCSFRSLQKIHILCDCLLSHRNLISP